MTRRVVVLIACLGAGLIQCQAGSLAGMMGAVYLAVYFLCALAILDIPRNRPFWLTPAGLVFLWLFIDFGVYGSLLALQPSFKIPMGSTPEAAIHACFGIGALSVLGFCGGIMLLRRRHRRDVTSPPATNRPAQAAVGLSFGIFSVLGILSGVFYFSRDWVIYDLKTKALSVAPPPGMGRYTMLVFMLPTCATGFWYWWVKRSDTSRRNRRFILLVAPLIASVPPLLQGRRLVWLSCLLMILHLCRVSGIWRVRWWHLALAAPVIIGVTAFHEANRQGGWTKATEAIDTARLTDPDLLYKILDLSIGRFDVTASLIANRAEFGYYLGRSFVEAPLYVLPSDRFARDYTIATELGTLRYGSVNPTEVSYAASYVGELYANFGIAGVLGGMFVLGMFCQWIDRYMNSPAPIYAVGYGLVVFRILHHMVTASYAWFPLTFGAMLPWLIAYLWGRARKGRRTANIGYIHSERALSPAGRCEALQ